MLAVQPSSPFTTTAVAAKKDPPTPSSAVAVAVAAQQQQEVQRQTETLMQHQQQQQHSSGELRSFSHPLSRPSGLDAILKDKIEFVEGSSTGLLGVGMESKHPYINVPNMNADQPPSSSAAKNSSITDNSSPTANNSIERPHPVLYDRPFNMTWALPQRVINGFINTGNTCFLNSVLQCLIHTAPLQHILKQHGSDNDKCHVNDAFCMICKLRDTMENSVRRDRAFRPTDIVNNLQRIAKTMRRGRQEDAHEFLRYSIDALQRSCLAGLPPKLDPKIAETSWVHKLFGGRLRSRVTCTSCNHVSDTFDTILDVSIDIQGVSSVAQALSKFVAVDHLRGANKYNCERCKKAVNAEKRFTVHDAPTCLTVHFKRFTPLGRKIGHSVDYPSTLDLSGAMSEGQHTPSYVLYGVISHAGGGPNSGHYYAHVRGATGSWYEANDECVTPVSPSSVIGRKNAYILFYVRAQGDALNAALRSRISKKRDSSPSQVSGTTTTSTTSPQPFIGPVRPPPVTTPKPAASLVPAYAESDESEDKGESVASREPAVTTNNTRPQTIGLASASMPNLSPIPPSSFYGDSVPKKRKGWIDDADDVVGTRIDGGSSKRQRSDSPRDSLINPAPPAALLSSNNPLFMKPPPTSANPFSRMNMSNNLNEPRGSHQKVAMVGVGITKRMKKKPHGLM